jgi:hypothetical protein
MPCLAKTTPEQSTSDTNSSWEPIAHKKPMTGNLLPLKQSEVFASQPIGQPE